MFRRIVEEKIARAIEAGEFDHLPGKGKPLKLEDNPYEPAELRSAHRLLKNNDFTLPWIETWNEIEAELAAARAELRAELRAARERTGHAGRNAAWELAQAHFTSQVHTINRRILGYNLSVPAAVFQNPLFNPEAEMRLALNE